MSAHLRISTPYSPGDEIVESSLSDFLAANEALDIQDTLALEALEVGEQLEFGGGAAPVFTVKRVA